MVDKLKYISVKMKAALALLLFASMGVTLNAALTQDFYKNS